MNTKLTAADAELIENYKRAHVLDKTDTHLLDPKDGLSIVMCGDPDQHPEAYSYQLEDIVKKGFSRRIYPPAPLGGALRYAPDSPANRGESLGYDFCLMSDLALVHRDKGIRTVALYVHAPCAIAAKNGMSFADIIRYAFAAKQRIRAELPEMKVVVFCHIDDGKRKQTWYVCRQRWEQFHSDSMVALRMMYPDRVTVTPQLPA